MFCSIVIYFQIPKFTRNCVFIEALGILRHAIFPAFVFLRFKEECPNHEYLTIYLENNGKNLKVLHLGVNNDSLNLTIAKFCTLYLKMMK